MMQAKNPNRDSKIGSTRWSLWVATVVVVVGAIVAIIAFAIMAPKGVEPSAQQGAPGTAMWGSPSANPSASAGAPTTPPVDPKFGAPVATTAPNDSSVDIRDKVTAQITSLTEVTATGTLPGEVSGSAAQVDLKITNNTSAEISLDGIAVNAYYGAADTPAPPYAQAADQKFPSTLAAGARATARFLFRIEAGSVNTVTVTVSGSAGSPIIVFVTSH